MGNEADDLQVYWYFSRLMSVYIPVMMMTASLINITTTYRAHIVYARTYKY